MLHHGLCRLEEIKGVGRLWLVKPSALATVISQLGLAGRPVIVDMADDDLCQKFQQDFMCGGLYVLISGA